MEMGAAVADQHTDGNCNHDGSDIVYGVKERKWDCQNLVVSFYVLTFDLVLGFLAR